MERMQARSAEQGVQLDSAASSRETNCGDSSNASMGNVGALDGRFQSPDGPATAGSSSQESEPLRMDEARKARSLEEMEREAEMLKTFMREVEDEPSAISSTN